MKRSGKILRSAGIVVPVLLLFGNLVINVVTIERDIDRINKSNLNEIKGAAEVTYHLQSIQSSFRKIFLETIQQHPQEVAPAVESVNDSFLKLHEYIALWEVGIEKAIEHEAFERHQASDQGGKSREHENFMVLKKRLMNYMACVEETLGILDVDGYTHANGYFEQQLEPLAEKVLALTRVFQADTEQEIIHELAEIRTAVHSTTISSACISIIVLLVAVLLIYDNSRKNRLPIENKDQAATEANTTQPNIELLDRCTEAVEDNCQSDNNDFMDWEYIAAISDDDSVVGDIVTSLLTTGPESMEEILHAIQDSNAESLKAKAHRFRGGALAVGASQLGEKALRLEQAGEQNDLTHASELFRQLRTEYMKVQTFLEQPDFIETIRTKATRTQATHV